MEKKIPMHKKLNFGKDFYGNFFFCNFCFYPKWPKIDFEKKKIWPKFFSEKRPLVAILNFRSGRKFGRVYLNWLIFPPEKFQSTLANNFCVLPMNVKKNSNKTYIKNKISEKFLSFFKEIFFFKDFWQKKIRSCFSRFL